MIVKILFTALIILAALTFVRYQNRQARQQEDERQTTPVSDRRIPMILAIAFVLLTLAISSGIYYSHWQQAHRLFTIKVTNSHSGEVQTYRVYQRDVSDRRFRTIDGREVHLSDAERMEVWEGVDDEGTDKSVQ